MAHAADAHLRRRPPGRARRRRQRPDAGRVPAARPGRLPDRRHRQHRRRPRREPHRGRPRPSRATSTCSASSASPKRSATATRGSRSPSSSRVTTRTSCARSSSSPVSARPSTTCSPTACRCIDVVAGWSRDLDRQAEPGPAADSDAMPPTPSSSAPARPDWPSAACSPRPGTITSCSNAGGSASAGGRQPGIRCGCSPRTG